MALKMTIADRISFGNLKLRIYNTSTGTSSGGSDFYPGCDTVWGVKALNNTDSSDTFKETVGSHGGSTKNKITLTPVDSNDAGQIWIWMR